MGQSGLLPLPMSHPGLIFIISAHIKQVLCLSDILLSPRHQIRPQTRRRESDSYFYSFINEHKTSSDDEKQQKSQRTSIFLENSSWRQQQEM